MTKTKTINSTTKRLTVISALLLFLVFTASGSVRAQLQTVPIAPRLATAVQRTRDQAPVVRVASSGRAPATNDALVVAPPIVGDPRGPLVLDLPRSNDRIYDKNVARTVDSLSIARPPLPAAAPAAPDPATPAGTFDLPAIPGTPQTPTTEALRAGTLFGILSARIGLRPLTIGILILTFVGVTIFARTPADFHEIAIRAGIAGFFVFGGISGLYAIAAHVFPTHVRATGTGFVIGLGRGGAVLSPILAGVLFDHGYALPTVGMFMAAGSLLAAIALLFLKFDTDRSAESIQSQRDTDVSMAKARA